jgi:hypothetical protein
VFALEPSTLSLRNPTTAGFPGNWGVEREISQFWEFCVMKVEEIEDKIHRKISALL